MVVQLSLAIAQLPPYYGFLLFTVPQLQVKGQWGWSVGVVTHLTLLVQYLMLNTANFEDLLEEPI